MSKKQFHPYGNETECLQIGDLTIENRVDRVSLFGSLDLTRDKEGLKKAKALKDILEWTLAALEGVELPDHIALKRTETVRNPFT